MTFTHALSTDNYGPAKFIVSANAYEGTHTTIASALTSASSGDTIFIRPGTYTENPTLKAGVNLCAYDCDALTPNVTISGKCTFTSVGTVSISGINLQTNSDFCLAVTGSSASVVNLTNCYITCSNNTGISYTSSSSSSGISIYSCNGNLATTGIAFFAHSSAGSLTIKETNFSNSGNSTTASTMSAGGLFPNYTIFNGPVSMSGSSNLDGSHNVFNCNPLNATALTTSGTCTVNQDFSSFLSGTASAISVGTGTTVSINNARIVSSNTNAITGAGTLQYGLLEFTGSSSTVNTTTQSAFVLKPTLKTKVFSITRDLTTASGTQAVTGIGFKPSIILNIVCGISGGATVGSCSGSSDSINNGCMEIVIGSVLYNQNSIAMITGTSASAYQSGVVSSLDSDGFTITWTKVSTPSGTATITGICLAYV